MVRGCVGDELEDAALPRSREGAGAPTVALPTPWSTPCEATDPLPAAFANEAANTSDATMAAPARTNFFMACFFKDCASRPPIDRNRCSDPPFSTRLSTRLALAARVALEPRRTRKGRRGVIP